MDSKIFLSKYRVPAEEIEAVGGVAGSPLAYEAEEIASSKKVLVEVVPAASLNAAERERLKSQAMTAKALNHANIAALYDFGVQDDHLVYVTEDLEGTTAEEWVNANGPMPVGPVLRIASQVVSALSAAAFHGIVHRAINPSNLVLAPGQSAQGEWPLVKVRHFVGGAPKIPGSDVAVAAFDKSTHYASPEQRERGTVDFRSEIYSLGCAMSFLLSGVPPLLTLDGPGPTPLTKTGLAGKTKAALPKKVGDLLAQMLSINPEARPPDPLAFYRMLQDCLAQAEGGATMARASRTPAPRSDAIDAPRSRRFPVKSLVRAAICLTMAAVAALVLRGYLRDGRTVRAEQPIEAPIGVTNAFASVAPAEMKPTDTTVSIAPLPTATDVDTRSATTNSLESVSTTEITAAPLPTTSDPQASPPPQETTPVVANNASDPPAAIDSSEVAAAPQVAIVPTPANSPDTEVGAVVLQSPPKEIKTPEVRRAEPADEPEVRRAELAPSDKGPAGVEPDRTPSRDVEAKPTETTSLVLKRTDSKPEVAPKSSAGITERPAKPKRQADEKYYLQPGREFEAPPTGRLPRGSVRGRFVGETADGRWMFELPSGETVTVLPPPSRP
jgi:serine/threonine-protein kinase